MNQYATNQNPRCNTCPQKHSCIDIYRQLGQTKSPSVILKIIVAFVIPLIVFVSALLVGDNLLGRWLQNGTGRTLLSLSFALIVSMTCVWLIKLFTRQHVNEPDNHINVSGDKHF